MKKFNWNNEVTWERLEKLYLISFIAGMVYVAGWLVKCNIPRWRRKAVKTIKKDWERLDV